LRDETDSFANLVFSARVAKNYRENTCSGDDAGCNTHVLTSTAVAVAELPQTGQHQPLALRARARAPLRAGLPQLLQTDPRVKARLRCGSGSESCVRFCRWNATYEQP